MGFALGSAFLLEQADDRVQASAHLLVAGLLEDTPQHGSPTGVARGEEIGKAEERLFEVLVLGEELLLTGREHSRIGVPGIALATPFGRVGSPARRLRERLERRAGADRHGRCPDHSPHQRPGHGPAKRLGTRGRLLAADRACGHFNASLARCR